MPVKQNLDLFFYRLWVSMSDWGPLDQHDGRPIPLTPSGPPREFSGHRFLGYHPGRQGQNLGTHGSH